MNIRDHIRTIPDFPKKGINFYDIATLMAQPAAWREAINDLERLAEAYEPDMIFGIESRGFLIASPLALDLGCGFGMIRKQGKLPGEVISQSYDLEYGKDEIELQPDLITKDAKILIVDDILATGGTMAAAEKLIGKAGGNVVGMLALIELENLEGRKLLSASFETLLGVPA